MAALSRLLLLIAALIFGGKAMAADLENTLYMDVPAGRVVIEMRPDLAPATVAQIKALVRRGFYDGIVFHRVIDGFMAQTGDPKGDGTGGSGHKLKAEFSNEKHVRGVVSMARASDPNSADSQFFIMFAPAPSLDGKYTIWGKVTSGHGVHRPDQEGRPQPQRHRHQPRQDHQDAGRRRRRENGEEVLRAASGRTPALRAARAPPSRPHAGEGWGEGLAPQPHARRARERQRRRGWLASLAVYREPRLIAVLLMGFSSGLPLALTAATLSFWLAEIGVSLTTIGLFSLVGISYNLKFLWSPLIDRLPIPLLTARLGRRRGWALAIQIPLALAILAPRPHRSARRSRDDRRSPR